MSKEVIYIKEEFDLKPQDIEHAESLWRKTFPSEYKEFLSRTNGGVPIPNFPTIKADTTWPVWGVERFVSVGDLILQATELMQYTWNDQHQQEALDKYNLKVENLLTFAVAERGCYYMNLDSQDFGQIYYCCYQDWDGLVRMHTSSFAEFTKSLSGEEYLDTDQELELHYL